ncbi:MAG: riboflavin synthase [Candidatus Aminicenantes bacterium]|nr:riboflavin synthase [Candidatus Aminicenantes bacterium]
MFTGIIHYLGTFRGYRQNHQKLIIQVSDLPGPLQPGESLAVNGVCLSLERKDGAELTFHLSRETLDRTNLGELRPGEKVNLELPLTLQTPLGGHLVTGHVDAVGTVLRIQPKGQGKRMLISFPEDFRHNLVPKGSIAVNGVSLTVASLGWDHFEVELIPLTLKKTNLGLLKPGKKVNLEGDIIGKYVYNYLSKRAK